MMIVGGYGYDYDYYVIQVGMASKPLHVRRLQKALQEWVQNPGELLSRQN